MQIRPTNTIQTAQPVSLQTRNVTERISGNALPVDQIEISPEARLMETQSVSSARADRIAEIRTQIAQGQYDTPERLELAVSRMFDEIA